MFFLKQKVTAKIRGFFRDIGFSDNGFSDKGRPPSFDLP